MTPGEAVSVGADHLVIGRPITGAADRARAVEEIIDEMEKGSA
jgi:orotidine-5'-phosphate decarboxylase